MVGDILGNFKAGLPDRLFVNLFTDGGPAHAPFPDLFVDPNKALDDNPERLLSL